DEAVKSSEQAALAPRAHFMAMYPAVIANEMAGNHERAQKWRDFILARRLDANSVDFFKGLAFKDEAFRKSVKSALMASGMPPGE
ncbi:MAG: hypothetical protein OEZ19_05845, partial [Paracoccaceae bacterium]|nr:hypothetical protein [Paracoccaceae bacterium]